MLTQGIFMIQQELVFEEVFGTLMGYLRQCTEATISQVKENLQTMLAQGGELSTQEPIVVQVLAQLEVLHIYSATVKRSVETFESQNYRNFKVITKSEDLAFTMMALMGLTGNPQSNPRYHSSVVSQSGF